MIPNLAGGRLTGKIGSFDIGALNIQTTAEIVSGAAATTFTVFRIKRWRECNTCTICEHACEWGAIDGPRISVAECVRCDDCERIYDDQEKCVHWIVLKKSVSRVQPAP